MTTFNLVLDVIGSSGLAPQALFAVLSEPDLEAAIDAMTSELPDRFRRTEAGFVVDFGPSTVISSGVATSGELELSLIDLESGSGPLTGRVEFALAGFAIDGRAPAVDGVALDLDLTQVDGDQVAGTVTLSSPVKGIGSEITGNLEFDSRNCELFPVGGSITVTVDGEARTISFSNRCDGGYSVDIPSAEFYRADMRVRNCDGSWSAQNEAFHLIQEDGELAADPSAPTTFGRVRWSVAGSVGVSDAEVLFARSAGKSGDGSQRVGWIHAAKSSPGGGVFYFTGPYGYDVDDGECSAGYVHDRGDPDFEPALIVPCEGPCTP